MAAERSRDDLDAALVKSLNALRLVGDNRELRTVLNRELAESTVGLRAHFPDATGAPDWVGRSWPYREHMRKLYAEAGYSRDEARRAQPSIRYHVASLVREQLTPEQVADLGLHEDDLVERARTSRKATRALLSTVNPAGKDVVGSAEAGLLLLQRIPVESVQALDDTERAHLRDLLDQIVERVGALLGSVRQDAARPVAAEVDGQHRKPLDRLSPDD
ncbi:hypothetical protein [Dactylosporangium sp. NPDC051484]|uniref:hypothetical protein n=1 Tax=Dactylosporangium sp. NPDC051484 TaxID=3154942 RepID=UPI00344E68AA